MILGNPIEHFSPFLPSTFNVPEEADRLNSYIGEKLSQFSDVINDKKIGVYIPFETRNGENWQYDTVGYVRHAYNYLSRIVSFPNTGTIMLPVPPNINNQFVVTQVWGSASKPPTAVGAGNGDFFSFFSQGDARVTFTMSDLAITLTTTIDLSAYTGFVVIEYIRNGT